MRASQGLTIVVAVLAAWNGWTATHYVVPPETPGIDPTHPFTNGWAEAATNIQDAVNAAEDYNTILVSTGLYLLTNEIFIRKPVTLRSWNDGALDRAGTVLHGNNFSGKPVTNRCVYIDHIDAMVRGFTITGGYAVASDYNRRMSSDDRRGGGVFIEAAGTLADCLVVGNSARPDETGGGVYGYSTTTVDAVMVTNCEIVGNTATSGAGVYLASGMMADCIVRDNQASGGASAGGGVCLSGAAVVRNTLVASNTVGGGSFPCAGGIYSAGGVLEGCRIVGNTGGTNSGGGVVLFAAATNIMRNCLVAGNVAGRRGSGVYIYRGTAVVENCTIVSNRATADQVDGAGVFVIHNAAGQVFSLVNCIVYDNDNGVNANSNFYFQTVQAGYISNTCIAPVPTVANVSVTDAKDTDPLFIAPTAADFRLPAGSPCVNTGTNQPWMLEAGAVDLDGRRRLDRFLRLVDMGCFEYFPSGSLYMLR